MKYDLIVIGSGPAGHKGAIAAAKMNKSVAIIERRSSSIGGVCLHTGTVPSKTIREAILHLTGYRQRDVYAEQYSKKRQIKMDDLRLKLAQVIDHELHVIRDQLERNDVDVYEGEASFIDQNTVQVVKDDDRITLCGDNVLVACGTKPARPAHVPFDGHRVFDSDEVLRLEKIPRTMVVIGGGVIGIEYALMFATLGTKVTVVDGRDRLLEFCDQEIVDTLLFNARALGMRFQLGEKVHHIEVVCEERVMVQLESHKRIVAETALFSVGRSGDTKSLNVTAAGLSVDNRGRIACDENHMTNVPNIYAVGDIVGFPALASTSMEQGRRAVGFMFGQSFEFSEHMPYGLFTIPEISMFGHTEKELTAQQVPYEVGIARFNEIPRGQICGDLSGVLKLLFHRETREILGVHCIGEMATEIIHIGQTVMELGGTIDYFCNTVFNYPTMAECYKVAAFDGINRLCLDVPRKRQSPDTTVVPVPMIAAESETDVPVESV